MQRSPSISLGAPHRRTFVACAFALLVLLACVRPLLAGEVQFRTPPREAYVGVPAVLQLEIRDASDVGIPVLPTVPGLSFSIGPGQHRATSVTIINGRTRQSTSETIAIEIVAEREGRYTVPVISIDVDGQTYRSEPFTLVAKPSETGDILFAEVVANPASPYVGQPTLITLRIWFKPYRDPSINLVLSGGDMWSLLDLERTEWGPFRNAITQLERRRQRPADRERMRGDASYVVFELQDTWTPSQPGAADFSSVEVRASWPTGARMVRDLLGRNQAQLTGARPLKSTATADSIIVRPLPEEDRPLAFSGAVGDFTVTATAKPTEVAVGDPITVVYTVKTQSRDPRALGALEVLQAPPFASLPELAKDFRIPSDQLGGTVREREKQFTQTFRPLHDGVTAIPPLPFAFFDPEADTYRVVTTEAIPITVRAAERLQLSQIVGGSVGDSANAQRTTVVGGLRANMPPTQAMLATSGPTNASSLIASPLIASAVAIPPLACLGLLVLRRVQQAREADPLRRRARRAGAVARETLAADRSAAGILRAITGFIADRCGLAEGARTRPECIEALRTRNTDPAVIERVDRLLAACERARYAPAESTTADSAEADATLAALEREVVR
jgi:hypothetical protein